jgi:hypothetical protein
MDEVYGEQGGAGWVIHSDDSEAKVLFLLKTMVEGWCRIALPQDIGVPDVSGGVRQDFRLPGMSGYARFFAGRTGSTPTACIQDQ